MKRTYLLSAALILAASVAGIGAAYAASTDPCRPATFCSYFQFAETTREPLAVYWPASNTVAPDEVLWVYVDQTAAALGGIAPTGNNTIITAEPPSCRDTQFSCKLKSVLPERSHADPWQIQVWMIHPGPSTPPDATNWDHTWLFTPLWVQYGAVTDPNYPILPWTVPGYGLANCQSRVDPATPLPYTDDERDEVACRFELGTFAQWPEKFFLHVMIQPEWCLESNPTVYSHLIYTQ